MQNKRDSCNWCDKSCHKAFSFWIISLTKSSCLVLELKSRGSVVSFQSHRSLNQNAAFIDPQYRRWQRRNPKQRSCARWDLHRGLFQWWRSFYKQAWMLLVSTSLMVPMNIIRKRLIILEPLCKIPVFSAPSCLTLRY